MRETPLTETKNQESQFASRMILIFTIHLLILAAVQMSTPIVMGSPPIPKRTLRTTMPTQMIKKMMRRMRMMTPILSRRILIMSMIMMRTVR